MTTKFVEDLVARVRQVEQLDTHDPCPATLFHFTDAAGLAGLLSERALWVSRAQSLNNASEVSYGLQLARKHLSEPATGMAGAFLKRVLACLEGDAGRQDWNVTIEPFVAAFCRLTDQALQWLHYGSSGTGFAIGFRSSSLSSPQFVLRRVIYEVDRQRRLVVTATETFRSRLGPAASQRQIEAAAVACAVSLRALAGRMMDPCFEAEQEWRLTTSSMNGTHVAADPDGLPQPKTRFRCVRGRIVPYVVRQFEALPICEAVIGFSAPDSDDDIRGVLHRAGCGDAIVRRSSIPVR